jgi:hypothetical protein
MTAITSLAVKRSDLKSNEPGNCSQPKTFLYLYVNNRPT